MTGAETSLFSNIRVRLVTPGGFFCSCNFALSCACAAIAVGPLAQTTNPILAKAEKVKNKEKAMEFSIAKADVKKDYHESAIKFIEKKFSN